MSSWMETKETWTGQRITVLPCSFSYEALKRALSTSQKVLSGEPDDLAPAEVLSGNSTTRTQGVPILTATVPNKSCHSGLRWLAREKRRFLFPVLLLCHWPYQLLPWTTYAAFHDPAPVVLYSLTYIRRHVCSYSSSDTSWLQVLTCRLVMIWKAQPQLEKCYPSKPDQTLRHFPWLSSIHSPLGHSPAPYSYLRVAI